MMANLLSACGNHVYHRVQPGDSLYSIGWQYGHDYRQVAVWNNLKSPYVLARGQWLRVAPPLEGMAQATVDPPAELASGKPGNNAPSPRQAMPAASVAVPPAMVAKTPSSQGWRWPARGELLRTFPVVEPGRKGVAIGGRLGQPVWAAAAGRVVYAGSGLKGYGNLLIIKHDDNYLTAYAHNHKLHVDEGEQVAAGQHIADMGKSGTERVMLHFEIRHQGKPVDPLRYLPQLTS